MQDERIGGPRRRNRRINEIGNADLEELSAREEGLAAKTGEDGQSMTLLRVWSTDERPDGPGAVRLELIAPHGIGCTIVRGGQQLCSCVKEVRWRHLMPCGFSGPRSHAVLGASGRESAHTDPHCIRSTRSSPVAAAPC